MLIKAFVVTGFIIGFFMVLISFFPELYKTLTKHRAIVMIGLVSLMMALFVVFGIVVFL